MEDSPQTPFAFRRQNGRALPDCNTPRRNSRAPTVMKIVTHNACHANAATCGHSSAEFAARPAIANGEDSGNSSANVAIQLPGRETAADDSPNIATCRIVIGSDSIWISRIVDACAPTPRNTEPNNSYAMLK